MFMFLITANPQNVEYMLKTNFHNYPKGKPFSSILGDLLGKGIFNVDGELWKFQRKMSSLELGSISVRSYAFDIVAAEIQSRLIPLMSAVAYNQQREGGFIDLQDVFKRFSFDCICRLSFGLDPGCLNLSLPISEFASAFDLASKLSAERAINASPLVWKISRFFNLGKEKQLKEAIKSIHQLADEVIRYKRKQHQLSLSQEDLLSRFMKTIDDDEFLRDIVISFLLAGRDTVASALTTFFLLLVKNSHVMKSILEESENIMRSDQLICSFQQLREMHYLKAAVHESMRLYPPIQFDSKFCDSDDILVDGTSVSKGMRVTYHPYAMGRMKNIWGADCDEFKPERWLQSSVFKKVNPFKYPVFQAGPRVCLGQETAVMEIETVAVSLIRKFEFHIPITSQDPKFIPGLTATISGGLPVIVRPRNLFV